MQGYVRCQPLRIESKLDRRRKPGSRQFTVGQCNRKKCEVGTGGWHVMRNFPNHWDVQVRHDCLVITTPLIRTDGLRPRTEKNIAVESIAFFFGLRGRKKITSGNAPSRSRINTIPPSCRV